MPCTVRCTRFDRSGTKVTIPIDCISDKLSIIHGEFGGAVKVFHWAAPLPVKTMTNLLRFNLIKERMKYRVAYPMEGFREKKGCQPDLLGISV